MKCEEFEDRLNQVLDDRQRPEWHAELRLHSDACPRCRDLAVAYGVLLDGFFALATPEPSADFSIRVLDAYRARPSKARSAVLVGGLLATAAAVWLLALPLAQTRRARFVVPPSRPVALESSQTRDYFPLLWDRMEALPIVGPVLISITDEDPSTDPYAALAKGTGEGLALVVLRMPPIGATPGLLVGSPNPVAGQGGWSGLSPVRMVVGETLDLLLQVLPDRDAEHRS